jgi:hypothetical protein
MLRNVSINTFARLGIQVWQPRLQHIICEPLRFKARCAVILFTDTQNLSVAMQKILDGMLSVLNLDRTEYMLLKVAAIADLNAVVAKVKSLQCETVLQLDMQQPALVCAVPVVRTFSPEYLLENTQYKAQAFKDLLTLRNILHHVTS